MQKGLEEVWEKGRLVGDTPFPIDNKEKQAFFIVFRSNITHQKHLNHEALSIVPLKEYVTALVCLTGRTRRLQASRTKVRVSVGMC